MRDQPETIGQRLTGCLWRVVLGSFPILCLLAARQYADFRRNGVFISIAVAVLWFAAGFIGMMWRKSLLGRFSLKALLVATVSLNVCLALILGTDDANWRFLGLLLLMLWTTVIGVGMLHSGVQARFEAAEKRMSDQFMDERKKERDLP